MAKSQCKYCSISLKTLHLWACPFSIPHTSITLVIKQRSQTCIGWIQQLWSQDQGWKAPMRAAWSSHLLQPSLKATPVLDYVFLTQGATLVCLPAVAAATLYVQFPNVIRGYFKDNKKYLKYSLEEVGMEKKVWWVALGIFFQGTCMNLNRDFPPT